MSQRERHAALDCGALLEDGLDLIEALSDEDYGFLADEGIWSSPGAHTRHLLDYVDCLVVGLDARRVDYVARKRRLDVERSREAGLAALRDAIETLRRLVAFDERLVLEVRADAGEDWCGSTLARELRFVASHAIHHHALIRLTLSRRGVEAPPEYGVSASTLAHRARGHRP